MRFFEHLERTALERNSLLCVGLDPRPEQFPEEWLAEEDPILAYNRHIVDATRDLVCAYKPNFAFYEAAGLEGLQALRRTIEYIGPEVPVILDAKRGDIGSTAAAYAQAAYEVWGAGAVTVHPYLGGDSVAPFVDCAGRGILILCHTSNPGAAELQTLACGDAAAQEPLYLHVARLAQTWGPPESVGLVVGATYPEALRAVRALAPHSWFLVPGIGTQGGDLEATVAAGLRNDGLGMVINVSRAVYNASDPRVAAITFRDQINAARRNRQSSAAPAAAGKELAAHHIQTLILDLADIGVVRFGTFTLKSGKTSPIYIDLRLLASHPPVLSRVAAAYAAVLQGQPGASGEHAGALEFDRIAAIPYAALPIGTAVALQMNRPLIYTRREVKSYGTQRAIEGTFQAGERAVVLDDLITTGESKVEAIAPLKAAGLKVTDIVVLIDRESGGREALARQGYRLHAVLTLRQILDVLATCGRIDQDKRAEVLNWLQNP